MDNLEKFIVENRDHLDHLEPGPEIWQNIEQHIQPVQVQSRFRGVYIWRAAAVLLLLAVIGLLLDRQNMLQSVDTNLAGNQRLEELKQVETYYTSMISTKKTEINRYLDENPQFRDEFSNDVVNLDSTYTGLKKELSDKYNDRIVDAMIVNLQLRIDILNQQLDILQRIKNSDKDETSGI
jgi:hypothetical protein